MMQEVAAANGKSIAQVALRWCLQKGFLPLPKSVTPANIEANLHIFDFELFAQDMAKLDKVEGVRVQEDPDKATW